MHSIRDWDALIPISFEQAITTQVPVLQQDCYLRDVSHCVLLNRVLNQETIITIRTLQVFYQLVVKLNSVWLLGCHKAALCEWTSVLGRVVATGAAAQRSTDRLDRDGLGPKVFGTHFLFV